jgi:hypothetical protein
MPVSPDIKVIPIGLMGSRILDKGTQRYVPTVVTGLGIDGGTLKMQTQRGFFPKRSLTHDNPHGDNYTVTRTRFLFPPRAKRLVAHVAAERNLHFPRAEGDWYVPQIARRVAKEAHSEKGTSVITNLPGHRLTSFDSMRSPDGDAVVVFSRPGEQATEHRVVGAKDMLHAVKSVVDNLRYDPNARKVDIKSD